MDDLRVSLARTRKRFMVLRVCAIPVLFLAILLLTLAVADGRYNDDRIAQSIFSAAFFLLGGFMLFVPRPKPTSEILRLAQARNGLLTVSEIATALDIDPALAVRTLKHLQKLGIAIHHWGEVRKNLWEFPDYVQLPISQVLDMAKTNGGRVSLRDLVASGHSLDIASQTFETLSEKGLGKLDPVAGERTLIVQGQ